MVILGISAFYHDSAAALIENGRILAAAEEERFTRKKHDQSFPIHSIEYCLKEGRVTLDHVDAIVFYDKPLLKFDRLLETYFASAPKGLGSFLKAMPVWLKEKIYFKKLLRDSFKKFGGKLPPIYFSEHHLSHAASAFYPSPHEEAAILCIDGVGEWATTSAWHGVSNDIKPLFEIQFPHSLGLFYSAFTAYLGFKVNSGEYKMMGLAPYGKPEFVDLILSECIHFNRDGSFQLNLSYFDFTGMSGMTTKKFEKLFNHSPRKDEETITEFHKNLAASVQAVTEMAVINLARQMKELTQSDSLTLAGGVALNCVANSVLKESGLFKNIWVQPASGDSGGAMGAALAFYYLEKKERRVLENNWQQGSLLGPSFDPYLIKVFLQEMGVHFAEYADENDLNSVISDELINGSVIGLFRGKMEFGPRALGSRSIIGDPRFPKMQSTMNLKIKKRESFRPFAPAVLKEEVAKHFYWSEKIPAPYMLFTTQVRDTKEFPATTHVDGSARLQVVDDKIHPRFHQLIKAFFLKSGCPVVINTSFNVRGEPIVCRPSDALNCFMTTDMDVLVLENFILKKSDQPGMVLKRDWKNAYARD
jgi:carbamoyltransferase